MTSTHLLSGPIEPLPGESRRQAERRTVAGLLSEYYGRCVTVLHDATGAPYIAGTTDHISISHCRDMAVVAIDSHAVGVDVETWRDQLRRVAPRFLDPQELRTVGADRELLLRAWTAKEAIYKLIGRPGTALRDLPLDDPGIELTYALTGSERVITVARYRDEP